MSSSARKFIDAAPLPIIPALDLMSGKVVRGIGGIRKEYRPWFSPLCPTAEPVDFAHSVSRLVGHNELYTADIDALEGSEADWSVLARLAESGRLTCDIGVRDILSAEALARVIRSHATSGYVVVASETSPDLATVVSIVENVSATRVAFSFDWRGEVLVSPGRWINDENWLDVAVRLADLGVRRFLSVDLAAVGVGRVGPQSEVCQLLRRRVAGAEIVAGGGVSDVDDVTLLKDAGCDAVLVATALHRAGGPPDNVI